MTIGKWIDAHIWMDSILPPITGVADRWSWIFQDDKIPMVTTKTYQLQAGKVARNDITVC